MKVKEFVLDEQTTIKVYKRSTSRSIRLSIDPSGIIKVSIPTWVPYKAAIDFAKSKLEWINKKRPEIKLIQNNQLIGKNHRLVFRPTNSAKISTRLNDLEAIVFYPNQSALNDPNIQQAAARVAKKALMSQGKKLLPIRLDQLASKYNYKYRSLTIKSLKTRWGSCDSDKNISLNLYLMELPWELIDYVLVHELNHTIAMHHGADFWQKIEARLPNSKDLRHQLKQHRPGLIN